MFLDIAVLFNGVKLSRVIEIFGSFDLYPRCSIPSLIRKCFIEKINGNDLRVHHDLLSQMAKEIVCSEAPHHLGQRTRIWFYKDSRKVLKYYEVSVK